jgi:hemerythrin
MVALRPPVEEVLTRMNSEHQQLRDLLLAVTAICPDEPTPVDCSACDAALRRGCEETLTEHLGEMLAFMAMHFRYEDTVMRDWQLLSTAREACEDHQRDHSRISALASRMVADLEPGNPLHGIRDLHDLVVQWIDRHIEVHDLAMIRLLQQVDEH